MVYSKTFEAVNVHTTDTLAKLLATENVTVHRSALAKTASFDLKGRILTLPILQVSKSKDISDMMTGHEVAHAIWTDMTEWGKAIDEEKIHKQILNVVEDARIERKIKRKYPGIVRSFITGYQQLANDNFFGDAEPSLDMPLIDRLNLHAKCGTMSGIPFYDEEQWAVDGLAAVETFEEAKTFAKQLQMDYVESKEDDMHSAMSLRPGDDDDQGLDSEYDDMDDFDELKSDGDDSPPPTRNSEAPDADKFDESTTDDLEDDEFSSEANFEENKQNLTDPKADQPVYFEFPKPILKNMIVPYTTCTELYDMFSDMQLPYVEGPTNLIANNADDYNAFRRSSQKVINYMVKEFERKKAASEYRRVSISKTGVLDVNKLHSYKYNEDIFLKKAIMPDGKNHGMVMLLDWSASMWGHMGETVKQLLNLVWFCQKVNIPFEVYAFSASYWEHKRSALVREQDIDRREAMKILGDQWERKIGVLEGSHNRLALLNFFSSRMRAADMTKMAKVLFSLGKAGYRSSVNLGAYELSSTPLPEALCAMLHIVPNFRNRYKLDKVNLITLTDGEGNSGFHGVIKDIVYREDREEPHYATTRIEGYSTQGIYSCPITHKVYPLMQRGQYCTSEERMARLIIRVLRESLNVKTLGLFLDSDSRGKSVKQRTLERYLGWKNYNRDLYTQVRKGLRETGFVTIPTKYCAYDEFYIVPTGNLDITDGRIGDVPDDITKGKLKNLFLKAQKSKVGSRVLAERLMTLIA